MSGATDVRTHDGYTIMKDERSGYWMFAEDAPGGGVRRSNRVVGRHAPTGIRKFLRSGPSRAAALDATARLPQQERAPRRI